MKTPRTRTLSLCLSLSILSALSISSPAAPGSAEPQPGASALAAPAAESYQAFQLTADDLRKQGEYQAALDLVTAKAKTMPAAWGENERWSMLVNMATAYVGSLRGPQAAIDYAKKTVAENTWSPERHAPERMYSSIWGQFIALKQYDEVQPGLDKFLAVCRPAEQPLTWYAKGYLFEQAGDGKKSIDAYTKALILLPGALGQKQSLTIWQQLEKIAPATLELTDYYHLCRKVLACYPPPNAGVDDWAAFISRVAFRKDSLQP